MPPEFLLPTYIGKYRVLRELGRGAMGRVLEGEDPHLGRKVAIKVLLPAADDESRERFLHEARVVGAFFHPNIVVLLEFGFHEDQPFLVMEHLEGTSPELWLKSPHELEEHLRILEGLCRALEHAHARGILHRDIKPSNVQVLPGGEAKLMDFGIARGPAGGLTATGVVLGTPEYIAPEILRDASYSPSADHYSLALVAYRALSGQQPFAGRTLESCLTKVLSQEPQPLEELCPELPKPLCQAVMRFLEKEPEKRPDSLRPLVEAIADARSGSGPSAPRTEDLPTTAMSQRPAPAKSSRRWLLYAAGAALVAAGWWGWQALAPATQRAVPSQDRETATSMPHVPKTLTSGDTTAVQRKPEPPSSSAASPSPPPPRVREPEAAHAAKRPAEEKTSAVHLPQKTLSQTAESRDHDLAPTHSDAPLAKSAPTPEPVEKAAPYDPVSGHPSADPSQSPARQEPQPTPPQAESRSEPAAATPPPVVAPAEPPHLDEASVSALRRGTPTELTIEGSFPGEIRSVTLRRGRHDVSGLRVLRSRRDNESRLRLTVQVDETVVLGSYSLVVIDGDGRASNALRVEVVL